MTVLPSRLVVAHSAISLIGGIPKSMRVERRGNTGWSTRTGSSIIRGLVRLLNNKFRNTVFTLLIRLCMTFRVEISRMIQAALAVQFWNGTQLQLIFVSAAMSIRSLNNEHFISDMTSHFSSNPFRMISCEIPVVDVFTD